MVEKKISKRKIFLVVGAVVLPWVTLNPIDSHKPMYCKENNDHHGDLATTPWTLK